MSNSCPYVAPPAGTVAWPAAQQVSKPILAWARANLRYPMGTVIQANVGGQPVIARLECHYHPPGGAVKPWGPHKGCTIYWPTGTIFPGVAYPIAGAEGTDAAVVGNDPCVLAGGEYICQDHVDWATVGISAGAGATVVALFLFALKHAGKAARPR